MDSRDATHRFDPILRVVLHPPLVIPADEPIAQTVVGRVVILVLVIGVIERIRKSHVRRMNEHHLVRRRISVGPVLDSHHLRNEIGVEVEVLDGVIADDAAVFPAFDYLLTRTIGLREPAHEVVARVIEGSATSRQRNPVVITNSNRLLHAIRKRKGNDVIEEFPFNINQDRILRGIEKEVRISQDIAACHRPVDFVEVLRI